MAKGMKRYMLVVFFACIILSSYFALGSGDFPDDFGDPRQGDAAAAGRLGDNFVDGQDAQGAAQGLGETGNIVINSVIVFLLSLFGLTTDAGWLEGVTYLFMGLILFLFTYSIVSSMGFFSRPGADAIGDGGNVIISFLVSIAITGLVLIALPRGFFSVILPSYGAMGAAILTFIPFLMIFWFSIRTHDAFMSIMVWALFSVYYLFYYFALALDSFGWSRDWFGENIVLSTGASEGYAWIYLIMGGLGAVMIFASPFIRRFIYKGVLADEKHRLALHLGLIQADDIGRLRRAEATANA